MSRVGKLPIQIPSGVTITVDSDAIKVSGAKGNLETPQLEGITVKIEDGVLTAGRLPCPREEFIDDLRQDLLQVAVATRPTNGDRFRESIQECFLQCLEFGQECRLTVRIPI